MKARLKRLISKAAKQSARSQRPEIQRAYHLARNIARAVLNRATGARLGWECSLRSARWNEDEFELVGWAYSRGNGFTLQAPAIEVWLESPRGERVAARVRPQHNVDANANAKNATADYANTGFRATIAMERVVDLVEDERGAGRGWQTKVRVGDAQRSWTGAFRNRNRLGSARYLRAQAFAGNILVQPTWRRQQGLVFSARRASAMAGDVTIDGRDINVALRDPDFAPVSAYLRSTDGQTQALTLDRADDGWSVRGTVALPAPKVGEVAAEDEPDDVDFDVVQNDRAGTSAPRTVNHQLFLTDAGGVSYHVSAGLNGATPSTRPDSTLFAYGSMSGHLTLRDTPGMAIIDSVSADLDDDPRLQITGRFLGALTDPVLVLSGARQRVPAELEIAADRSFTGHVPLLASEWDGPRLPLSVGASRLRGIDADGLGFRVACVDAVIAQTPQTHSTPSFRLKLQMSTKRRLRVAIGPPRRDDELGSFHQRRLETSYRKRVFEPAEAVYFESFYGRKANDNPYALDRVIARRHPELARYWGVVDASVPVPSGAVAVIAGTKEWWQARGSSRYVIINDWIRGRFVRQPFQIVLQTWHGSMFKRIGLDRPNPPASTRKALETEKAKWSALVSQNRHSSEIFATAYAWDGVLFEEGYPRNDAMSTSNGAAIRARLGIRPDQTVVLYAPTWRDNASTMLAFLDLAKLETDLGEDYVLLLRGHSRTLGVHTRLEAAGVIDVTTYPDVTELFLASDVLVTDYSSVMFDFSVTGRPMIFFVPDLAEYRDSIRGVYFDLAAEAPGPVVISQDEVLHSLRRLAEDRSTYAERYRLWQERFNPYDDGHSAERVVDRLFGLPAPIVADRAFSPNHRSNPV